MRFNKSSGTIYLSGILRTIHGKGLLAKSLVAVLRIFSEKPALDVSV